MGRPLFTGIEQAEFRSGIQDCAVTEEIPTLLWKYRFNEKLMIQNRLFFYYIYRTKKFTRSLLLRPISEKAEGEKDLL
jgi:hypothetical protein